MSLRYKTGLGKKGNFFTFTYFTQILSLDLQSSPLKNPEIYFEFNPLKNVTKSLLNFFLGIKMLNAKQPLDIYCDERCY